MKKIDKYIDIKNLLRWETGKNKGCIDWGNSIGKFVKGKYGDLKFVLEIISYNRETQIVTINYNNDEYQIRGGDIVSCKLGKILNQYGVNFRYNIKQRIKDKKRDLTIIDREYRQIERIDKKGNKSVLNDKWYKYICNKCGHEDWKVEANLTRKNGCASCSNQRVVEGINDIPTTDPWMIPYFQGGLEEAKLYTYGSSQSIHPICPDCGRVKHKKMKICTLYKQGVNCICSDHITYPEKFIYSFFEQLQVNFKTQLSKTDIYWCKNYRYDFYFEYNDEGYILEAQGIQHYEESYRKNSRTLEEEQENDKLKKELALANGIKPENYIVIDCRKSDLNWIKDNENGILNSRLNELFVLSNIDWLKCHKFTLSNLVKIVCEYKKDNPDLRTGDISNIVKLNQQTITKYLKQGTLLGWCNYNAQEEHLRSNRINALNNKKICSQPVFCVEKNLLFESATMCSKQAEQIFNFKISQTGISKACRENSIIKGYHFKYIKDLVQEEYIKYDIENKLRELNNKELGQAC